MHATWKLASESALPGGILHRKAHSGSIPPKAHPPVIIGILYQGSEKLDGGHRSARSRGIWRSSRRFREAQTSLLKLMKVVETDLQ